MMMWQRYTGSFHYKPGPGPYLATASVVMSDVVRWPAARVTAARPVAKQGNARKL